MKKNIKIIIGADLVPTYSNKKYFCDGNIDYLFGDDMLQLLNNSDIKIFNLETPLILKDTPIKKCGPVLGIDCNVIKAIKKLNPTCLGLANNHIMDHGVDGFKNTILTLEKNEIEYCGIGTNINKLKSFVIKQIDNYKIGIYACAEHEFSIATNNKPGANPFDPVKSYDDVKEILKYCDFLIVLYHGGKEFYPYPSPNLQNYCRKFIDSGADIVVCQHSHCIGCEEQYKEKRIIYGQGNFIFDDGTNLEEWNNGLLINLLIQKKHSINKIDYKVIERKDNYIRFANKNKSEEILNNFFKRSKQIKYFNFINENYKKFSEEKIYEILRKFDLIGNSFLFRILNKLTNKKLEKIYFNKIYLKQKSLALQNVIECEAWRELLLDYLKNYNKKNE